MSERSDSRRIPRRWLDVLELVLDESIEREGGIRLAADDLRVEVPLSFGEDADRAEWGLDGSVTIETEGTRGTLAEWYHLHRESLPDPDERRRGPRGERTDADGSRDRSGSDVDRVNGSGTTRDGRDD